MKHNSSTKTLNSEFDIIKDKAKLVAAQPSANKINSSVYLCEAQEVILRVESHFYATLERNEYDDETKVELIDQSKMRLSFLSSALPHKKIS